MAFRPVTLQDAWSFVGKVAKIKAEKGYEKDVQQDFVKISKKNLCM